MATVIESFESGTTGASVTTTNVGSGTGTGTGTYSTEQAAHGTKSMKVVQATAGRYITHNFTSASTTRYPRMYVYFAAVPSASTTILSAFSGGVLQGHVRITTTGAVQLRNTASAQVGSLSTALALSTWHRIEMQYVPNGTSTVRIFSGTNVDGTTPDQTITGAVGGTGTIDQFLIGPSSAATWTSYMDDLGVSDTGYVGPAAQAAAGTTAAVSATSGSAGTIAAAAGSTAATSTAAGSASSLTPSAGATAATSAALGAASSAMSAAGATAAMSATSGSATTRSAAAGTVGAVSTTTGAAGVIAGPVQYPSAGTVAATTTTWAAAGTVSVTAGSVPAATGTTGAAGLLVGGAGTTDALSDTTGSVGTTVVAAGETAVISDTTGTADVIGVTQFKGRILAFDLTTPQASADLAIPAATAHLSIPTVRGVLS